MIIQKDFDLHRNMKTTLHMCTGAPSQHLNPEKAEFAESNFLNDKRKLYCFHLLITLAP